MKEEKKQDIWPRKKDSEEKMVKDKHKDRITHLACLLNA